MKNRILWVLMVTFLVGLFSGCEAKPVAVVNNEKISWESFNRYFEQVRISAQMMGTSFEGEEGKKNIAQLKNNTLDRMIDETLILQESKKRGIEVDQKEIQKNLEEQVKANFENDEKFREWLTFMKMTDQELERQIKVQLIIQKLFEQVSGKIEITDAEAQKHFEKDKNNWKKIKVSHILISAQKNKASQEEMDKAKQKAKKIIQELNQGGDFATLAQKHSDDSGSAAQGGALALELSRNDSRLVPEFVAAAFQLDKVGDYSREPVLSNFGYHIIKLDKKISSFEDVKGDIKSYLTQVEQSKKYAEFMNGLRKKANITKNFK
ncbi:MAG: peptidylprolyl isomerase [Bacillota bacterium]|jgi:parvulin-like peptidyl-prolyl isomerase